jgi:hypothetical protein
MPENLETHQQLAEGFEQLGTDPFDSPVPGESLTSDPDNRKPYEKPSAFTDVEKAMSFIFDQLTEDENYEEVLQTMREGVPLDMLAQVYLTKGFQEGQWNPDLMLLLIEPTIYLLMWLATGVEIDFQLDSDGDDLEEEEDKVRAQMQEDVTRMNPETIKGKLPSSLLSKVNTFEAEEV